MFPLIFLHQNPIPNKGRKNTPLEIAVEKSQACFETMLELVVNQTSVCVTSNLLGRLKEIINNPSPAVIDFFANGFRTTEQLEEPKPLIWNGDDEELFFDVPSAYLTNETLQSLVFQAQAKPVQEEKKDKAEPADPKALVKAEVVNGFVKYQQETVEKIVPTLD